MHDSEVIISGGGPCGILLALYLSKRGISVSVFEKGSDPTVSPWVIKRAANIDLSARACLALSEVGLLSQVIARAVPIYGRQIHFPDKTNIIQSYDPKNNEMLYTITRENLYDILLSAARKNPLITFNFNYVFTATDIANAIDNKKRVFGCDGAFSVVRQTLDTLFPNNTHKTVFSHGYKELTLPVDYCEKHLAQNYSHKWIRENMTFLAHPNVNGTFTGTLILPLTGKNSFEVLKNEQQLEAFFEDNFDDLHPVIPGLVKEFFEQPLANLTTVTVNQQHYNDEILLLGDATHTMLPFLGQGTNCGFEDCRVYNKMWENDESLSTFSNARKKETDAIVEMSATEYRELLPRYSIDRELEILNVERIIVEKYKDYYIPYRSLVLFSHIPYSTIQPIKKLQLTLLKKLAICFRRNKKINWKKVEKEVMDYFSNASSFARVFAFNG